MGLSMPSNEKVSQDLFMLFQLNVAFRFNVMDDQCTSQGDVNTN